MVPPSGEAPPKGSRADPWDDENEETIPRPSVDPASLAANPRGPMAGRTNASLWTEPYGPRRGFLRPPSAHGARRNARRRGPRRPGPSAERRLPLTWAGTPAGAAHRPSRGAGPNRAAARRESLIGRTLLRTAVYPASDQVGRQGGAPQRVASTLPQGPGPRDRGLDQWVVHCRAHRDRGLDQWGPLQGPQGQGPRPMGPLPIGSVPDSHGSISATPARRRSRGQLSPSAGTPTEAWSPALGQFPRSCSRPPPRSSGSAHARRRDAGPNGPPAPDGPRPIGVEA